MRVLVDTPVWSEFLRRNIPHPEVHRKLNDLITDNDAILIGPVRQEILSGIKDQENFSRIRTALRTFPDEELLTEDFELAAEMFNQCRSKGIQGTNTDLQICAVSVRLRAPIFTLDRDFANYASVLPITLLWT